MARVSRDLGEVSKKRRGSVMVKENGQKKTKTLALASKGGVREGGEKNDAENDDTREGGVEETAVGGDEVAGNDGIREEDVKEITVVGNEVGEKCGDEKNDDETAIENVAAGDISVGITGGNKFDVPLLPAEVSEVVENKSVDEKNVVEVDLDKEGVGEETVDLDQSVNLLASSGYQGDTQLGSGMIDPDGESVNLGEGSLPSQSLDTQAGSLKDSLLAQDSRSQAGGSEDSLPSQNLLESQGYEGPTQFTQERTGFAQSLGLSEPDTGERSGSSVVEKSEEVDIEVTELTEVEETARRIKEKAEADATEELAFASENVETKEKVKKHSDEGAED